MKYKDKTKKELLKDLRDLQQKYDAVSLLYETEKSTLAALVENNSDVMLVKDCNRRIIAGNSAFLNATGYGSLTELIGKTDAEILNISENTEPVFSYKQEDLKALKLSPGESIQREENIPFPNGELKTFLTKKFPIFTDKKLVGIGVITSDITERKQVEQNLLELNHKNLSQNEHLKILTRHYQLINDYSSDVTAMYDDDGNPVYISPSIKNYVGYEASEFFSKISIFDIVHPDDKQQLLADIEDFKKRNLKNYTTTYRIKHKKGHYFWNESISHVIEEDGKTYTIVNSRNIDERKNAELAIRESEEKFRALYNNAPLSYQSLDENGCFIDINPMWLKTMGYDRNEVLGDWFGNYLHPDYVEHFKTNFPAFKKHGYVSDVQFKLRKKDGKYIHVSFEGRIGYTSESKFKETYCVFKDITEQKALEDELKEKTSFLSTIMETSPVGIVTVDKDGNITFANNRAEQILGLEKEEITSRTYDAPLWKHTDIDGSPFPDEKQPFNIVKKTLKTVFDIQHGITWPDGRVVLLSINAAPIKNKTGKFNGMIASIEDITERKLIEKELKESEKRFRYLFRDIPTVAVQGYQFDGTTTYWNKASEDLYGYTAEEAIGRNLLDLIIPSEIKENVRIEIRQMHESLKPAKSSEMSLLRKDGKRVTVISSHAIVQRPGNTPELFCLDIDISQRKQAEKQLKESEHNLLIKNEELIKAKEKAEESNRLKTEFLNNMSHEIRTPMNGIMGFADMLDKPDLSNEKRKYFSKIIQNSSRQLLRIIDDILEISTLETKQEKLNETEFCLNDLLMQLFSIFNLKSKERNIPFYLKKALHDDQSYIVSDKTKLNKILSNLLVNALKFTSEGFIEFGYYIKKVNLILYVKDTGIGISPKNHTIVFERFSQEDKDISSKHGGLGLGLSICKENAQLLGGDISLESEKGKGSTFYVTIPYKPARIENDNTKKSLYEIKKSAEKYTILVAEDEEVNYLYIEVLFEDEIDGNYKLIHAKNGKEAVEICTIENNIDLVLMDLKMPIMNGHEATEKIKEKYPNLPIIAQTAYSTESDKQLALKHGCDDFISKPINKEKLFGLINKYLNVR